MLAFHIAVDFMWEERERWRCWLIEELLIADLFSHNASGDSIFRLPHPDSILLQINDLKEKFPVFTKEELMEFYSEFQRFDIDGSGDIDHYEIMQLFGKVGEKIPKKAAQAIIAQFDEVTLLTSLSHSLMNENNLKGHRSPLITDVFVHAAHEKVQT